MNIKYTTSEVLVLYNNLDKFCKKDIKLPMKLAWVIEDNSDAMKEVVSKFEKFKANEYGKLVAAGAFEPAEEPGMSKIKPEFEDSLNESNRKLEALLNIDNEINIKFIKRDEVPEELTMSDLRALKFMIETEEV